MSLYGLNSYMSNSVYNSFMSGNSLSSFNKNNKADSSSDLMEIAKKAAMVRSPSYRKNMLEEFKKAFSSDGTDSAEIGSSESEAKLSSNAKDLSKYASALASNSFNNWAGKDSSVKNFVETYNKEIESLADATEKSDLGRQATMINTTQKYKSALGRLGISVGEDNKLLLDEDVLKRASDRDARLLLSGDYSYASKLGMSATGISDDTKSMVKNFAESYNNTIDGLKKSDSANALTKGVSLVNISKAYSNTLSRIGLNLGSDNRMKVDEDKLSKASESDLKALFNGSYSYASKVADKSSYISNAAGLKAQVTYTAKGLKNSNTGMFDTMYNFLYNKI
ncbi:MAG: hypothetical protein NC192_08860 [Muribaculaceae bacterium]|nr:hypothetical protein [Muribaculaceae bacterium]